MLILHFILSKVFKTLLEENEKNSNPQDKLGIQELFNETFQKVDKFLISQDNIHSGCTAAVSYFKYKKSMIKDKPVLVNIHMCI